MSGTSGAASSPPRVTINYRAATRLHAGHVWVYKSDVLSPESLPPASLVHVEDERGRILGTAFASSSSQIALRLIGREHITEADVPALLSARIRNALAYRARVVQNSNACRLVFSEADSLPGLIADRYNNIVCLHFLTQAMDRADIRQSVSSSLLQELREVPELTLVERVEPRIRELEQLPALESHLLHGAATETTVTMNGLDFAYKALEGQKTGAFLDQRENYAAAAHYASGSALDVFCYHGGFAMHLARVCRSVIGVDISRAALEQAEANGRRNVEQFECGEIEWLEANAFDLLRDYASLGRQFDTIVLDPPAFAKSKRNLESALSGYKELNLRALQMLRPGGVLITNSCSQHVSEADFLAMLASAAADVRRNLRILEKRTQAKDHPILLTVPETYYLKCIVCTSD